METLLKIQEQARTLALAVDYHRTDNSHLSLKKVRTSLSQLEAAIKQFHDEQARLINETNGTKDFLPF